MGLVDLKVAAKLNELSHTAANSVHRGHCTEPPIVNSLYFN